MKWKQIVSWRAGIVVCLLVMGVRAFVLLRQTEEFGSAEVAEVRERIRILSDVRCSVIDPALSASNLVDRLGQPEHAWRLGETQDIVLLYGLDATGAWNGQFQFLVDPGGNCHSFEGHFTTFHDGMFFTRRAGSDCDDRRISREVTDMTEARLVEWMGRPTEDLVRRLGIPDWIHLSDNGVLTLSYGKDERTFIVFRLDNDAVFQAQFSPTAMGLPRISRPTTIQLP